MKILQSTQKIHDVRRTTPIQGTESQIDDKEFLCSRTTATEPPTDRDPEERHYVRTL